MKKLSPKQRKFVEAYAGNAVEAARKAGYSGNANTLHVTGHDLLRNPTIKAAIESRQNKELKSIIATRQDRQNFWTKIMLDEKKELHGRLKASELLGKSEADFTDKIQVSGSLFERLQHARKRASGIVSTYSTTVSASSAGKGVTLNGHRAEGTD